MKQEKIEPEDWVGKTIKSCEVIRAEHGRTYSSYLCVTFTDGSKHMISIFGFTRLYDARPPVEEMKKAPNFFSPDDIADEVKRLEVENRKRVAEAKRHKEYQFEKLKKELGK
tara:strand:- start:112 stop:447 length:336 start_codon:yes stop_codon:yes gene_type:complete